MGEIKLIQLWCYRERSIKTVVKPTNQQQQKKRCEKKSAGECRCSLTSLVQKRRSRKTRKKTEPCSANVTGVRKTPTSFVVFTTIDAPFGQSRYLAVTAKKKNEKEESGSKASRNNELPDARTVPPFFRIATHRDVHLHRHPASSSSGIHLQRRQQQPNRSFR
jgi:molybdopterin-guanine dinucleotide biosynthesis protein A